MKVYIFKKGHHNVVIKIDYTKMEEVEKPVEPRAPLASSLASKQPQSFRSEGKSINSYSCDFLTLTNSFCEIYTASCLGLW